MGFEDEMPAALLLAVCAKKCQKPDTSTSEKKPSKKAKSAPHPDDASDSEPDDNDPKPSCSKKSKVLTKPATKVIMNSVSHVAYQAKATQSNVQLERARTASIEAQCVADAKQYAAEIALEHVKTKTLQLQLELGCSTSKETFSLGTIFPPGLSPPPFAAVGNGQCDVDSTF
ncbi:hypothetical protein B0H19DRAFT_1076640 [Mycena capillaripes]|nr:hypothetical protein B0H19DRAFT_1076640 [Mycena capillaripes]